MTYYINRISQKAQVEFILHLPNFEEKRYIIKGRVAQTLVCLVEVGQQGITSLEVGSWAVRLASYIYDLKNDYGVLIDKTLEPHEGGRHARYRLGCLIEIISITEPENVNN